MTREEFVTAGQPLDRMIAEIAIRQHGLVTRSQLLEAGVTPDALRSRVRSGRLQPVQRGVYQVGPVVAPRAREMAAVLACGPGAVLSHWNAAALWKLCADRGDAFPVDITIIHGDRGRRPGMRVHRVRGLQPEDVTVLDGIPITTVARAIFDVAGVAEYDELRQILAVAARQHATNAAKLWQFINRQPTRQGVPMLRALLQDDTAPELTRSEPEQRLLKLIRKVQLPRPEVNARVGEYEVDFLWREQRMVVEVDGFAFHSSRERFEKDRRRDATLAAWGYRVMRVTWRQLEREPEATVVRLAQALVMAAPPTGRVEADLPGPARGSPRRDGWHKRPPTR